MLKPSENRALLDDEWTRGGRLSISGDSATSHLLALLWNNAETFARWGEALERIADDDYPLIGRKCYRDDGKLGKYDTCVHSRFRYEGCADCAGAFARKALEEDHG